MRRLKLLILVFCLAISIPLAYVVWQTYQGLAQEERAQLRFFSESLFDEIENKLAELVQQEENRAIDEYQHTLTDTPSGSRTSSLAQAPREDYILGYLQNNPDGSFQTPLVADMGRIPEPQHDRITQLTTVNTIFNQKKFASTVEHPKPEPEKTKVSKVQSKKKEKDSFADRYLTRSQQQAPKSYLGRKTQRTEEISAGQALNLSKEDLSSKHARESWATKAPAALSEGADEERLAKTAGLPLDQANLESKAYGQQEEAHKFQVEVAPLQSVFINDGRFFIFRRIAINNQIFRQGFVLKVQPFLRHLAATCFEPQPMAGFTGLSLQVVSNGHRNEVFQTGAVVEAPDFITQRTFPAPFDFLSAAVQSDTIPVSPVRQTLNVALAVLGLVMLLGLMAIYQSARIEVDLSERRSQFVSSVTHELKTPLTNIRMYIEMLEQGIAATPEREQDYFQILGSESARLSRLINNVLELAKLEKKQRHFDLQQGDFKEVLAEVQSVMTHKLGQEGFTLETEAMDGLQFAYDREVMIQILINLIDNSIKFGRKLPQQCITIGVVRQEDWVRISFSDTGPGIPRKSLKRVFDDFYRVDNDLTRSTGGTGIGLALVKKFISAMGGRVQAANNTGPGCTITLILPASPMVS